MDIMALKRCLRGKSQKDIAAELGISAQRLNNYVCGKREPDNAMLERMADFFGVSVDYLLGRDGDTKKQPATKDELQNEIMERFAKLSPPQQEKAIAFIQGLLASQE